MKASELRLEELVSFGEGRIDLHGRRLVLHGMDAIAQWRADLVRMVGSDAARRILTRFGYFTGQADAAALERVYPTMSLRERLAGGPRLHSLAGAVRAVVRSLTVDATAGRFSMEITWHESAEAEEHLAHLGRAAAPVCWILVGYASGYASFCLRRPVFFIESQCRAVGARVCKVVGRDVASWGPELDAHRPYFDIDDIHQRVQDLTEELRRITRENDANRDQLDRIAHQTTASLVAVHSRAFQQVLEMASRAAHFDASVLVYGESGVGKEVLARHIHRSSPRAERPFVAITCGALPETLLESELFGHAAGAFTGARGARAGLFEAASGGTVFLDELTETSTATQVKLLRVLQEREIVRVGENTPRKIDVRVVAATNRDVHAAIREGILRDDLYYRLAVVEIRVPPLRERKEDILALARSFVRRSSEKHSLPHLTLHATCAESLLGYHWPGNIRELENAIEHAAVLSKDGVIRPRHLPASLTQPSPQPSATPPGQPRPLAEVEHDHIRAVLAYTNGNRARAAELLGIGGATLWRKLKADPVPRFRS
ncbi:MAG: sigma 54-interacting transcriptional regulator [Polyangiaceae bacterium]|nr:sigma 54-interacting transcriptional regulator [Polyangiaceae bacterium]